MGDIEGLDGHADRRRRCRRGLAAVDRSRLESDRGRLALHAGSRPRVRRQSGKWSMAGEFANPAARAKARVDQHGAGHPRASPQRSRHGPAEALHRAGPGRGRRRRAGCDGAGAADLPAAGISRSLRDLALASRPDRRRRHAQPAGISSRPASIADLPALALYDRPMSGMERPAVLAHLAGRQPGLALVAETGSGKIAGFMLGREGRVATSIGPVVADSEAIALALIARATASTPGPFIMDVPDAHGAIRAWLQAQGAVAPRGYMRMTLGTAEGLDDPSHLFALAGPELG